MRSLVSTNGKISPAARNSLAKISSREFFEGDLEVESGPTGNFSFHKALQYPVALTRLSASNCRLGYRRGWTHIRRNQVGFRVIWFVQKGSLQVSRSLGNNIVEAGQATFIDSNTPFHAKTRGDESGEYESLQLMVPAYLFFPFLQEADRLARPLDLSGPDASPVREILSLLSRTGESVSQQVASSLSRGLLASLADLLERQNALLARNERLGAERFAEFQTYIEANLENLFLSLESTVAHLGVSARYLCYVLQANGTTFSRILWKGRLQKARDRLRNSRANAPIEEIARSSGFKSPAHFSRLFKAEFAITPSQFRKKYAKLADTDLQSADLD